MSVNLTKDYWLENYNNLSIRLLLEELERKENNKMVKRLRQGVRRLRLYKREKRFLKVKSSKLRIENCKILKKMLIREKNSRSVRNLKTFKITLQNQ